MKKAASILLAFIISWMFFYPMTFRFLPSSVNSKMMIAALGIVILGYRLITKKTELSVKKGLLWIFVLASVFSLSCFFSVTYNNTSDMDYTSYIVSMVVWLCAAYASVATIGWVHGKNEVQVVCNYIIALCLIQAVVSLIFTTFPIIREVLNNYIVIGENTAAWETRLYGLGVSSDTGGIRFSIGLICIAYLLSSSELNTKTRFIYIFSFVVILILGNLMSRTTTIGGIIALAYYVLKSKIWRFRIDKNGINNLRLAFVLLIILVPIAYSSYKNSPVIQDLAHFGFEGFFNLAENGEWSTRSGGNLDNMWDIWPETFKTWMIGDGRFLDPEDPKLFYMRTDVGYARFIFYCGLVGLVLFSLFFIYVYYYLKSECYEHRDLFRLFLLFEFIVWIKVSTDLFFIFAIFISLTSLMYNDRERRSLQDRNDEDCI